MSHLEALQEKARLASPFGGIVRIDLHDGEGPVTGLVIDGRAMPVTVAINGEGVADAVIRLSSQTLGDILAGHQNPTLAFMTGKLQVTGAMGLALRLAAILEE